MQGLYFVRVREEIIIDAETGRKRFREFFVQAHSLKDARALGDALNWAHSDDVERTARICVKLRLFGSRTTVAIDINDLSVFRHGIDEVLQQLQQIEDDQKKLRRPEFAQGHVAEASMMDG